MRSAQALLPGHYYEKIYMCNENITLSNINSINIYYSDNM